MLRADDLLSGLRGRVREVHDRQFADLSFGGVCIDSRQARPGDLFVALRGERDDGHNHIDDAIARGATGVIASLDWSVQRPLPEKSAGFLLVPDPLGALQEIAAWWRGAHEVRVVAVTGSVGKTSTKEAIAGVLGQRYGVLRNASNYNNEIGLPLTLLQLNGTHERAVLEMGMYDLGDIALLCRLAVPQVGVVTNVGDSHLERLGTRERIAQAKGELVESLPEQGTAILNGDDPHVRGMAGRGRSRVLLFGCQPGLDLWAGDISSRGLSGLSMTLHRGEDTVLVTTPLVGRHNVYTVLAAAAVGLVEGLSWDEVVRGLSMEQGSLRLAVKPGIRGSTIIDDCYNASPASTLAALDLLSEVTGRKVAVLGDMLELGPAELTGHQAVGMQAGKLVDCLIVVGCRARYIGDQARAAGLREVYYVDANQEAVKHLWRILGPGDHVLVKGSRGMRMEEIVEAIKEG
ncbi:MAG: UDP-N-acetylmuramoyl-tripeptide--D-alanyl-D-alanine ligase [Chloroflexota bacterium]|nr:MAG: UDP-N-acetylmuramoyl-tripeptide--D-alanyl-D-alanine ligase [Chloroflexota bacterium]